MNEAQQIMDKLDSGETLQNFFTGSVPQNYDAYMSFLFAPYASDISERINVSGPVKVLELACGTGQVTKRIFKKLPENSQLIATDISPDMLAVAKEKVTDPSITWELVDMASIPYTDEQFDLIVCQFGLMFVPDKLKALSEMRRVLKTGGKLIFNTWGNIEKNPVWQINFQTFKKFFGELPVPAELGPFGLPDEQQVLDLMEKAGFKDAVATPVNKTTQVETAALAAKGFLLVSPAMAKDSSLFPKMQEALESEFKLNLGDNPLESPLLALVFEASK